MWVCKMLQIYNTHNSLLNYNINKSLYGDLDNIVKFKFGNR